MYINKGGALCVQSSQLPVGKQCDRTYLFPGILLGCAVHATHASTGCPTIEYSLCFGCFLGFQCSYRGLIYHFSTAQETTIPKLSLFTKIYQVTEQNVRQTEFRYDLDKP